MEIKYPDVQVQLVGQSGNAFAIIGAVAGAIRREISPEAAKEYSKEAMKCGSYDELLSHAMRTVYVF